MASNQHHHGEIVHEHTDSDKLHVHSLLDGSPQSHDHTCEDLAACQAILDGVLRLHDLCMGDELFLRCLEAGFPHAEPPPYPLEIGDITDRERRDIAFSMVVDHLSTSTNRFAEQMCEAILVRAVEKRLKKDHDMEVEIHVLEEDSEEESMVDRAIRLALGQEEE